MNNLICTTTLCMPEMLKKMPAQQTDSDHANDDFAALFSAPVLVPQVELTKKQEPENPGELNGSVAVLADQIETSAIPQTIGTGITSISLPSATEGSIDSTMKTVTANSELPDRGRVDYGLQVFSTKRQITNFEVTTSLRRKLSPPLLAAGIAQLDRKHFGPTALPIRRDNASFEVIGVSDPVPNDQLNAEVFLERSKLKIAEIPRVPASSDPKILEVSQQRPETTVSNIVEADRLIPASPRLYSITAQQQIKPKVFIASSSNRPIPTDQSVHLVLNEREVLSDIKQIVGTNKQTFQLDLATGDVGQPLQYPTLLGDDANRSSLPDFSNLSDPAPKKSENTLPREFVATPNADMEANTVDPKTAGATIYEAGDGQIENAPAAIGEPGAQPTVVAERTGSEGQTASLKTSGADILSFSFESTEKEIKPETLWAGFDLPGVKPQKLVRSSRPNLIVERFATDISKPANTEPNGPADATSFEPKLPVFTVETPKLRVKTPELTIKTPVLPGETPELTVKTPVLPVETPKLPVKTPELAVKTPVLPVETPELAVKTPVLPVETSELTVKTPVLTAEKPELTVKTPVLPAETPELTVKTPVLPAETPELTVETPKLPAETPELTVKTPKPPVATSELTVKTPVLPAETPEITAATSELTDEAPELPVDAPAPRVATHVAEAAKILNFTRLRRSEDRTRREFAVDDVSTEKAADGFIEPGFLHQEDSVTSAISPVLAVDNRKLTTLPAVASGAAEADELKPLSDRNIQIPAGNTVSQSNVSAGIADGLDSAIRTGNRTSNPGLIDSDAFTRPEKIERGNLTASNLSETGTIPSFASVLKQQTAVKSEISDPANVRVLQQLQSAITQITQSPVAVNEKRTLKMRLNPEELGSVEITIEKSSSGKITAHFQTESESTRQILQQGLEHLRTTLESTGSQVGDLKISCGSSSSNGNESSGNKPQQFGSSESRSQGASSSEGVLNPEDDPTDRLVSLRA